MGNSESSSSNSKTNQQISLTSREVRERRRFDLHKVQNVLVIWLDNNIDDSNKDYQNTMTQIRQVINDLNIYTDDDQCIEFLETIGDRKVCMIFSGSVGQHIIHRVHNMIQVHSIFIFCSNKRYHEGWTKEWPKIKGVYTEIKPICVGLKQATQECEQNIVSISFVGSNKRFNQLDPSFMYTQILKEILLTIKFDDTYIQDYIVYCRDCFAENETELNNAKFLKSDYHKKTPIWWYTYECFLYRMLNCGIRMLDGDIITRMGFFINDLHRHIEKLYEEQHISETFTVYRGQGLSKVDFEQLNQTSGGLMSFNNFLSTSTIREVSLDFAERTATNPDLVGVLFVMKIDPTRSTTSFALIHGISAVSGEGEVLFSMHSVFQILDIRQMKENKKLYEVNLTLTNDNDKELSVLTEHIRKESFPDAKGWYRLGLVLKKLGQDDKAEEIFKMILNQTTQDSEKGTIYQQLGWIKYNRREYQEALRFYEKSLSINENILPLNHPDLTATYNNIGGTLQNMGEYSKALSWYEKALAIQQQSLSPNHPDLAMHYNNIGTVYYNMHDYVKALSSYEKALSIKQQSLPSSHPSFVSSYNNIGLLYETIKDYAKAYSFFERAIEIGQKSLPANHRSLLEPKQNLERVKSKL